jgi:hypothetical protein
MFQLTNAASGILERAHLDMPASRRESEFGYRFQSLVAAALKCRAGLDDLYENKGAGQPDCYSAASGYGFEIKTRADSPVELDENSWSALPRYPNPRLVAMLTTTAPFPIWVLNLQGVARGPIHMDAGLRTDAALEAHLKTHLSALVEAVGTARLTMAERGGFDRAASEIAATMFPTASGRGSP